MVEATTTTEPTTTTTTVHPLSLPCQCLGDPGLLANLSSLKAVLAVCRENSGWRRTADGLGVVGERTRCGSRTPANPRWTWDSACNCTEKHGPAGRAGNITVSLTEQSDPSGEIFQALSSGVSSR